jgi:hypothetical protein
MLLVAELMLTASARAHFCRDQNWNDRTEMMLEIRCKKVGFRCCATTMPTMSLREREMVDR